MPSNDHQDNIRCEMECSYPAEKHVDGCEVSHLSHDREQAEVLHEPVLSTVLWIYTTYNNKNIESDYLNLHKNPHRTQNSSARDEVLPEDVFLERNGYMKKE